VDKYNRPEEDVELYHFLSSTLGQRIPIPKIIDFNVLDVVAVRDVHLAIERGSSGRARRLSETLQNMLAKILDPQWQKRHTDLMGGTSTCWIPRFAWICALILAAAAAIYTSVTSAAGGHENAGTIPAAAAGSMAFLVSADGVAEERAVGGLLLRRREVLAGERERSRSWR
jgi:hypothetical protein